MNKIHRYNTTRNDVPKTCTMVYAVLKIMVTTIVN